MAKRLLYIGKVGSGSFLLSAPFVSLKVYAGSSQESKTVKISELPLYEAPNQDCKIIPEEVGKFRSGVSLVRQAVWKWLDSIQDTTDKVKEKLEVGKAHTQATIDYIQSDPGILPRLGVITVSGLGGVILGYKGGYLRKTAYGSFAILASASLCYPKEAVELTNKAYEKFSESTGIPGKLSDIRRKAPSLTEALKSKSDKDES